MGASSNVVEVKGSAVQTSVKLDSAVRNKLSVSLVAPTEAAPPDRVFLTLENIRGTQNAPVLAVYLNLPAGANAIDHPELLAGSIGLFGLRGASAPNPRHGGQGLSFTLEITKIMDALHLEDKLNQDSLQVTIVPSRPLPEQTPITIGRISIYRKGH
jgi:tyrosinase